MVDAFMSSLEHKLYQLVIGRLNGDDMASGPYRREMLELARKGIGGFIVFGGARDRVRDFIAELQAAAPAPLFIASDIERGVGQQLEGATDFPSQMAAAAAFDKHSADDVLKLEAMVRAIAAEAVGAGINMPLIPVMDVNSDPDNPIICTRAFSDSPSAVAWYGAAYIRILQDAGLISCAKHFPGHGDTAVDSHISLPVISKSAEALEHTDIMPFREAVKAGVGSIMLGHITVPAVDSLPAPVSEKIVTGMLRKDLGFQGLIMTDALNMSALNDIRNTACRCINAGADILLHPENVHAVVDELKSAAAAGDVDRKKIDAAAERIFGFKSGIKDIRGPEVDYRRHESLAETVAGRSVTLVKGGPGILPLSGPELVFLACAADENAHDTHVIRNYFSRSGGDRPHGEKGPHETVIAAVFTSVAAWRGSSGVDEGEVERIQRLIESAGKSVVVSFGSPYVLRHFGKADVLVAAYDTDARTQAAVIKCLTGEREMTGSLPVRLDLA